jgi:hypothetical protein
MACRECRKLRKRVEQHEKRLDTLGTVVLAAVVLAYVALIREPGRKED